MQTFGRRFGAFLAICLVYWVTRLWALTTLPVFADEAIYIRWAQMIANEPQKYLFLPMYDGKPPLHMWLLTRFLPLTPLDPLWSARLMSVSVSFITLLLLMRVIRELGGNKKAALTGGVLYVLLPFTFFHDRLAVIDPLLVMWLTATFLGLLITKKTLRPGWAIMTGIGFGLALMSKTAALFFTPIFPLVLFLIPPKPNRHSVWRVGCYYAAAAILGVGIFYVLKVSELFPFLFNRSNDFGFSLNQVIAGEWRRTLVNLVTFSRWSGWYITVPLILLPLLGSRRRPILTVWLFLMALAYAAPFLLVGKIVFSRYYLPLIIWLIPAAALSLERLVDDRRILAGCLMAVIAIHGIWFMSPWLTGTVSGAHLPKEDVEQYLTAWSAGFGNREVRDYLTAAAQTQPVVAATEGFFGTLPDGLLMYFDKSPLIPARRIEVFGIGEPITGIPQTVRDKTGGNQVYIVVNQNRLKLDPQTCCEIVGEYPRPFGGAHYYY